MKLRLAFQPASDVSYPVRFNAGQEFSPHHHLSLFLSFSLSALCCCKGNIICCCFIHRRTSRSSSVDVRFEDSGSCTLQSVFQGLFFLYYLWFLDKKDICCFMNKDGSSSRPYPSIRPAVHSVHALCVLNVECWSVNGQLSSILKES